MYGHGDWDRMGLVDSGKRLKNFWDPQNREGSPYRHWEEERRDRPGAIAVLEVHNLGAIVFKVDDANPDELTCAIFTDAEIKPVLKESEHALHGSDVQIQVGETA